MSLDLKRPVCEVDLCLKQASKNLKITKPSEELLSRL